MSVSMATLGDVDAHLLLLRRTFHRARCAHVSYTYVGLPLMTLTLIWTFFTYAPDVAAQYKRAFAIGDVADRWTTCPHMPPLATVYRCDEFEQGQPLRRYHWCVEFATLSLLVAVYILSPALCLAFGCREVVSSHRAVKRYEDELVSLSVRRMALVAAEAELRFERNLRRAQVLIAERRGVTISRDDNSATCA